MSLQIYLGTLCVILLLIKYEEGDYIPFTISVLVFCNTEYIFSPLRQQWFTTLHMIQKEGHPTTPLEINYLDST